MFWIIIGVIVLLAVMFLPVISACVIAKQCDEMMEDDYDDIQRD